MAKRAQQLKRLNIGAGLLHMINFVAGLILVVLYSSRSFRGILSTDFNLTYKQIGQYPLVWVDLPFSFITALFHLYLAYGAESNTRYRSYVFVKGYNPYRWIEYAITASLMTWVIMQVAGVTNVITLVVVGVVGNVVLQFQGHLMDISNPSNRTNTIWTPTAIGWLLFCAQWALIWSYFFALTTRTWVVYTIVIGCFVFFCLFGLLQLLHYMRILKDPYVVELGYMTLSYTAKFYLNWNLLINMILH